MSCELEICAYSLESCRAAKEGGADRVELCGAMYEGGTTPSAGMIRMARQLTEGMQLYVMIRPRGGDFLYSGLEYAQMEEEIRYAAQEGADGVVIGLLNADGSVDRQRTAALVGLAAPMKVTFHRAFDMSLHPEEALKTVIECGCHRILTSGTYNTALEGKGKLEAFVKQADGRIEIMAGSGVNAGNARELALTGVNALHMSAKSARDSSMVYRNSRISMGGISGIPEYDIAYSDVRKIRAVAEILNELR